MIDSPSPIVVVGAGVLGASTATQLARTGNAVTLITAGDPADGASGRSLAWLNSAARSAGPYHRLRLLGIQRYREFAVDHADAGIVFGGSLNWAAAGASYRQRHEQELHAGYPSQWVSADEATELVPAVDPAAIAAEGAIFNPDDGWVELPRLISVLLEEFVRLGGSLITGAGRCRVEQTAGRATAVLTGDGRRIAAERILLAAGAGTPALTAELGFDLPEQTPIAALVHARAAGGQTSLRTVLNTPRVSIRPTVDGGLVMDAGWSEREIVRLPEGGYRVPDSTIEMLLVEARTVLAGHPELTLLGVGHGPKPIPGDGEPVLGPLPGVDGCHLAFTHSGATLGLITGELLAEEVITGTPSPLLADFRPDRFAADPDAD
ncbi:MAG TPA: FAD-binding oxidoreductase [Microlunatus sp.]